MTLAPEAITWEGLTIGSNPATSDLYLDAGIEGWGQPAFNMPSVQRAMGGEWGGTWSAQAATYTANAWMDVGDKPTRDPAKFKAFRSSMKLRPNPADEVALAWSDLLWDGEVCAFVRPTRCVPVIDEDAVEGGTVGWDAQWLSSDATVYDYTPTQHIWATGDPVSSDTFTVGNTGDLVERARRAWRWRFTAHGTTTNPKIRVEHLDGSFEQILFQGLTMTGGQVLTIGADMTPRVQSQIVSGHIRCTTNLFGPDKAPRWPLLHPDDGEDPANEVTVTVDSGAFSGFCETRSTQ